jgi:hypothetical protein
MGGEMNINLEIVSGKSVAGIEIGENISKYLEDIYDGKYNVESIRYNNPNGVFHSYNINMDLITINTLESGEIISITCNQEYSGKYRNQLHTGMSVENIIKNSNKQLILHGCLIVNNDFGFYFILPSPYDEIADNITQLPKDLVLNYIHVENIEWWIKPDLTPDYAK